MHFWPKLCGFVASSPQILEYFLGTITCLLAKRKEDTRWGEIFFTFFLIHSNYWDCAVDHIRSSTDHPPFFLNANFKCENWFDQIRLQWKTWTKMGADNLAENTTEFICPICLPKPNSFHWKKVRSLFPNLVAINLSNMLLSYFSVWRHRT